jgi:hypothetical protein
MVKHALHRKFRFSNTNRTKTGRVNSGWISYSCFPSGTRRFTAVNNLMIRPERKQQVQLD